MVIIEEKRYLASLSSKCPTPVQPHFDYAQMSSLSLILHENLVHFPAMHVGFSCLNGRVSTYRGNDHATRTFLFLRIGTQISFFLSESLCLCLIHQQWRPKPFLTHFMKHFLSLVNSSGLNPSPPFSQPRPNSRRTASCSTMQGQGHSRPASTS